MNSSNQVGREAINLVEGFLIDHPHLQIDRASYGLTVRATEASGFDVEIKDDGREAIIWAGGWHGHFDDPQEAASTFMWMLTPETRVVLIKRGNVMVGWRLEWNEDGKWSEGQHGRILIPLPFWWVKKEEVLQNALIVDHKPT